MPWDRRRIFSNTVIELSFRAREGIPFPALMAIRLIIKSALARTQRDGKVILCHEIWNGSHCHIILVIRDAEQFVKFYMELKKKLTDAIKRLLGLRWLRIWGGRVRIARIYDLEMAQDRISYIYANPGQDNLEDTIERFPGYSTWENYLRCTDHLDHTTSESVPWIRLPSIPEVSPKLTERQDRDLVQLLLQRNKKQSHELKRDPNAWMKCFGVTDDNEVSRINAEIVTRLRAREETARELRAKKGRRVMGAAKLRAQPIMAPHTPKKHDRNISILASCKEVRIAAIHAHREFQAQCRECYSRWRAGDFSVIWPPGAFRPALPPSYNALSPPPGSDSWLALAA